MKSPNYLLLIAFTFFSFKSSAQSDLEKLTRALKFEEAKQLAFDILEKSSQETDEYQDALYQLGVCQLNLGELDESKRSFKRGLSLPVHSNKSIFWKGMAMLQHEKLNYDSALHFYELGLVAVDKSEPFYIQLLIDKGIILLAKEQHKKAAELFFKAKQLYDQSDFDHPYLKLLVHSSIGEYYLLKNDYKNAELNLKLAKDIGAKIIDPYHPMMAELHESLGLTYINLENEEAMLYHYERVYDINKKGKAKGSYDLIVANNIMGMSLLNTKHSRDEVAKYLMMAYEDMVTYFPQFDLGIHIVGMNLGIAHYFLENYELAKEYLHESIEAGRNAYGVKAQTLGEALGYLAQAYEDSDDNLTALQIYTEGIESNILLRDGEILSENTEAIDVVTLSFVLQNRALFFLKRYLSEGDTALLTQAKSDADLNLKILQKHQELLPPESRSSLSYELNFAYYISTDINWHIYQNDSGDQYVENILNNIEQSKSDYLRVSLALAKEKASSDIPEDILKLEEKLQIQKEELRAKIIAGENQGAPSLPWDSLVTVQQRMDSITDIMGSYMDSKYSYQRKTVNDLQNQLASNEAVVDFMYQNEVLFQFIISKNEFMVKRDSVTTLNDQVATFRDEVQSIASEFTSRQQLSELLIEDLEKLPAEINTLTIIPDGILHYLPFDLLGSGEQYLLERYDISYANFIELSQPVKETNYNLISFAPDFGTDRVASLDVVRSDLAAIPGAFEEVKTINELFDGTTITSSLATETNFKQMAQDFGLIHMATHAIVDDSDPEISRLVFNFSQDTLNDGYLHAYEIFNMNLNAKLVTLSACNTGYGKIERGEGVMSLSWAFAYAGVPATVVSLWPASDKSTPELMKYFYQNLKEGQAKDVALNNARKQYLENATGKARHPFYWGGFVLIGDNSPIEEDRNLLVWGLSLVLVLALVYTIYRRRSNSI